MGRAFVGVSHCRRLKMFGQQDFSPDDSFLCTGKRGKEHFNLVDTWDEFLMVSVEGTRMMYM